MRFRSLPALQDQEWTRLFLRCLAVAFILHLLAAVFSVGFYHTDEHFQILEFLNYKLGKTSGNNLAIEFGQRIRAWAQPGFYYLITRALQAIGENNPFHWVFVFRFVSGLLGWLSLAGLSLLSYEWFDDPRLKRTALWLMALLWYLPALHARHSSENLSSSVFYLGATALFLFNEVSLPASFWIGVVFGLSFLFRYQVAFLVVGAMGFYWIAKKAPLRNLIALSAGVLIMIGLGVGLDHWGYGVWTFTPWNYFHYNLILGHVHDVDTQPVWDFFTKSLTETFPGLGFLTLCAFALGWIFRPFHVLTAITLPLYLVHSVIGHKELRFIFPIADAGPFLILLALTAHHRAGEIWRKIWWSNPGRGIWRFLIFLNIVALIPTTLLPCWAPARMFEKLYDMKTRRYPTTPMEILYKDKNPLEILGIPLTYYRPPDTTSLHIDSYAELNARIAQATQPVWFFEVGDELPSEAGQARTLCKPVAQSRPDFVMSILRWKPIQPITHRVTNWITYRCERS